MSSKLIIVLLLSFDYRPTGDYAMQRLIDSFFRYFNMPICLYKHGFIELSLILQAVKCHAASSPSKTLQIQYPSMLYFLTYTIYFVDKYNVINDLNKYLIEYF